jgi:polysaccharide biosynthesis/export protein VpsN
VRLSLLPLCACLVLLAPACVSRARPLGLPSPVELTILNPGDVFEMRIFREEGLPSGFTVAPDGTVDVPLVGRVHVAGLEPQEVADTIRKALIAGEFLSRPIVSVNVKEYNSKRIEVLGEVARPGSIPLQPGMTLVRAISLSGGFTAMAAKAHVTVRRRVKGATHAATISVEDIMDARIEDPPLQAGDSINVAQRVM